MAIHKIYINNNTAIIEMELRAMAKNGRSYNNQHAWIQEFKDGKITKSRV